VDGLGGEPVAVHAHVEVLDASEPIGRGRQHVDGLGWSKAVGSAPFGGGRQQQGDAAASLYGTQAARALPLARPDGRPELAL